MLRSVLLLVLAVLFADTSASAQYRAGPVRSAATAVRPAPAAAATARPSVSTSQATTPPVSPSRSLGSTSGLSRATTHGNSSRSNRPQHMYGIFRTERHANGQTGKTTFHKFGVSGGSTRTGIARASSNRALRQVNQLNRAAERKGELATYSTRILRRVPPQPPGQTTARQLILKAEREAVTSTRDTKRTLDGNIRPKPRQ